jgi:hypothetical protein
MPARFARLRRPALAAILCGCSAGATYVTVPMSPIASASDASTDDGADATVARPSFRPLPNEPTPASPRARCRRVVACRTEDQVAASVSYPPPFERCTSENGDGARFSPRETRDARRADPHACCYVAFLDCRT